MHILTLRCVPVEDGVPHWDTDQGCVCEFGSTREYTCLSVQNKVTEGQFGKCSVWTKGVINRHTSTLVDQDGRNYSTVDWRTPICIPVESPCGSRWTITWLCDPLLCWRLCWLFSMKLYAYQIEIVAHTYLGITSSGYLRSCEWCAWWWQLPFICKWILWDTG